MPDGIRVIWDNPNTGQRDLDFVCQTREQAELTAAKLQEEGLANVRING